MEMENINANDWANAFHRQAQEDFTALRNMNQCQAPSTYCMLLQMVLEKLSKAKSAKSQQELPKFTHDCIRFTLKRLSKDPRYGKEIKVNGKVEEFATALEKAQPSVAKKNKENANDGKSATSSPILEYPWINDDGKVCCPANDLPLVQKIINPLDRTLVDMINFLRAFIKCTP